MSVAKVMQLVTLATDPGAAPGEAANAAIAACRLIRKQGIRLLMPFDPEPARPTPKAPPHEEPRAVRIKAKYEGRCRECGGPYDIDEPVWWVRGQGCWHSECR